MIKVWTGISGAGKSKEMFRQINEKTDNDPLGHRIYIITPTQNTLTYEEILTTDEDKTYKGSLRTTVLSFSRFIWHVFNEIGHREKNRISEVGHIMLIHKILEQFEPDTLKYYKDSRQYIKFSQKLLKTIQEFINYDISADDIESLTFKDNRTKEKYEDLVKVYRTWIDTIEDYSIENINLMPHFLEVLQTIDVNEVESLNHATIYIDGFHNFTELELQLIKTLTRFTDDITLLLMHSGDNLELFRKTENVIDSLKREELFGSDGVKVIEFSHENYRANSEGLYEVERFLRKGTPINSNDGVKLIKAPNMRVEVEEVMRQIETLVRTKNVRYKDIGILYRDSSYIEVLRYYFEKFDIAYSVDQKYKMVQHPFIQFMMSVFNAYRQNFKRESIINIMKSGYLNYKNDDDALYFFENVILESGIDYKSGLFNDDLFRRFLETRDDGKELKLTEDDELKIKAMLDYKNRVLGALENLYAKLNDGAKAIDYIRTIYRFLEENGVLERLERHIDDIDNKNRQNETEDAYNHFIGLLDDANIVYGEETVEFNIFVDNLMEGLLEAEFNLLPATLDEVTVGLLDLAKVENKKYIFMIGMNNNVMPMDMSQSDIITDEEKEAFELNDIQISPRDEVLRQDERFVFYHGVTRPTDGLFISYAVSNLKNEPTKISPFVEELKNASNMPVINPSLYGTRDVEYNISSINSMRDLLLEHLRNILNTPKQYKDTLTKGVKDKVFLEALQALKNDVNHKDIFNQLVRQLSYKNESEKIDTSVATELYGDTLNGSVSRFQSFYNCQFQHFMDYGLKIDKREEFKLEAVDLGNLYHSVIEDVLKNHFNYELREKTPSDINKAVTESVNTAVKNISHGIFEHTGYYRILKLKSIETITDVVINLQRYLEASNFNIQYLEEKFGHESDLFGAYQLETEKKNIVNLRGVIDRIDTNVREDGTYISLIDYKSSKTKDLDLKDVYLGTELQQFIYMNIIESNVDKFGENVLPLTMMFYPVVTTKTSANNQTQNKLLTAKTPEKYEEMLKELKEDQLKPKGLIVVNENDVDYLEASTLDTLSPLLKAEADPRGYYKGFKSKGKVSGQSESRFLSIDMYERFKDYAIEKVKHAVDDIYDGNVKINPILEKGVLEPCRYCKFKSACNIDYMMNQRDFVDKDSQEVTEAVEKIKRGGEAVE